MQLFFALFERQHKTLVLRRQDQRHGTPRF
jgi:hypothetical protein